MRPRFHAPDLDAGADRVELPEEEAEHLVRVLRLRVGDEVEVFDGRGALWRAEVVHAGKKSAAVRPVDRATPAREIGVRVTLVVSVLKGDKMDNVVRDAVMLGVSAIQPVISQRTETSLATIARGSRIARWERIAVASAKQCGRAVVPEIYDARPLDGCLSDDAGGVRVMCVEPSAVLGQPASVLDVPKAHAAQVIIGPEGGWTVPEVAAADRAGVILMSLGGRTLRADAVPIVALTALLTAWSELT